MRTTKPLIIATRFAAFAFLVALIGNAETEGDSTVMAKDVIVGD
jgi:hypothetical protein